MKQYDHFGEYMFDLLFAPLKKGKRTANQFYIFLKVIGRVFDGLKEDALRVRDETNVITASPVMLPVHGQDRNMPRMEGEDVEAYRVRLAMKGIISEWGGVQRGILYVLAALGYEQARIESVGLQDPERWAEFIVDLGVGNEKAVRDIGQIYNEIQTVKEGSSKLAGLIITEPTAYCQVATIPVPGPRGGQVELPRARHELPTGKICATPLVGINFSVTTLSMAAHEGG